MTKEDVAAKNIVSIMDKLQSLTQNAAQSFDGRLTSIQFEVSEGPFRMQIGIRAENGHSAPTPQTEGFAVPVWNKPGHGVVALIAAKNLQSRNPGVWAAVEEIMANDPSERAPIITLARWPDDNKQDRDFAKETGGWHYVDIPYHDDQPLNLNQKLPDEPHAVSKFPEVIADLKSTEGEARADALAWVLHLAGDLHQPLHCITLYNADFPEPDGDRGGNGIKLPRPYNSLHGLWDGLLVDSKTATETALRKIANSVVTSYPESAFTEEEIAQLDPEAWAREGYLLAVKYGYDGIVANEAPSDAYLKRATEVARKRAALGGYRLSRVLEKALGGQ